MRGGGCVLVPDQAPGPHPGKACRRVARRPSLTLRGQDHYTVGQPGLQRMMFRLQELVTRVDGAWLRSAVRACIVTRPCHAAELAHHLEAEGISFLQLSFRWMNCLLMRELPLRSVVRLWDTYMAESDGFDTFHGAPHARTPR